MRHTPKKKKKKINNAHSESHEAAEQLPEEGPRVSAVASFERDWTKYLRASLGKDPPWGGGDVMASESPPTPPRVVKSKSGWKLWSTRCFRRWRLSGTKRQYPRGWAR